jgi:hypothetical protein
MPNDKGLLQNKYARILTVVLVIQAALFTPAHAPKIFRACGLYTIFRANSPAG